MTAPRRPHLGACPRCEQGLLRLVRCPRCKQLSVLCDDCEALWSDPQATAKRPPDGRHPLCPHCGHAVAKWTFATAQTIRKLGLKSQGMSE
jgi:hypothetical protein